MIIMHDCDVMLVSLQQQQQQQQIKYNIPVILQQTRGSSIDYRIQLDTRHRRVTMNYDCTNLQLNDEYKH